MLVRLTLNSRAFFCQLSGHIIYVYYPSGMETDGIKMKTSGYSAFWQGDSTWIGLAEALELLEWLEFQRILWGYDSTNQDYIN